MIEPQVSLEAFASQFPKNKIELFRPDRIMQLPYKKLYRRMLNDLFEGRLPEEKHLGKLDGILISNGITPFKNWYVLDDPMLIWEMVSVLKFCSSYALGDKDVVSLKMFGLSAKNINDGNIFTLVETCKHWTILRQECVGGIGLVASYTIKSLKTKQAIYFENEADIVMAKLDPERFGLLGVAGIIK